MLTLTPVAGFGLAFLIAAAMTPWLVQVAVRLGAVDRRSPNKIHARDVPRLGGLAIAAGFYLPVLGLSLRANLYESGLYADRRRIVAFLLGGVLVLGLGVFDDLRGARANQKLALQIPVALLVWWAGLRIEGTHGFQFPPSISLAVTVAWMVIAINAINLLDGLDGLASGVALQALITTALLAWHRGDPVLALIAICLSGAVAGFLLHNFHPAKIFMGDTGSMFLGYVLAVASIWSSQKAATAVSTVLPIVVLAVPLMDTTSTIMRRLWSNRNVMMGDLDHLHHRLLQRGLTQRRATLILYGVAFYFDLLAVVLIYSNERRLDWPLIALATVSAVLVVLWLRRNI
jgi:UDP-GlcNAc:undecaprenyl-phosphate GlcNAc-1-phosphate transferase